MNEIEFIKHIKNGIDRSNDIPDKTIQEVDSYINKNVCTEKIWNFRGDIIQMGEGTDVYLLEDAEKSYQKAIEINPNHYEAYESLGYFHDCVMDNEKEAKKWFRLAKQKK